LKRLLVNVIDERYALRICLIIPEEVLRGRWSNNSFDKELETDVDIAIRYRNGNVSHARNRPTTVVSRHGDPGTLL